jgi:mannose-6-phosphate isomerase-like protein (cupin superfamily)
MKIFCHIAPATLMLLPLLCATAFSQAAPAVTYSPQELIQIAQQMREQAKNSGAVDSGIVEKFLDSSTIVASRDRDGQAELHERFEDVFVVLQGNATLVSGGTVVNPRTSAPGEIRGPSVQGGVRKSLREGDMAHIPANVPHQLLVQPGSLFTYFVVKVPVK